jgi:SSS family solute:Na+ symporter
MLVPVIVILPGLLGLAVLPEKLVPESVAAVTGGHSYNDVLPLMLARYCGPGLLGLGITALTAGFMSGMAGNVSAFTTCGPMTSTVRFSIARAATIIT